MPAASGAGSVIGFRNPEGTDFVPGGFWPGLRDSWGESRFLPRMTALDSSPCRQILTSRRIAMTVGSVKAWEGLKLSSVTLREFGLGTSNGPLWATGSSPVKWAQVPFLLQDAVPRVHRPVLTLC